MTEDESFTRAIVDGPGDDLPRLASPAEMYRRGVELLMRPPRSDT
jgi:hypothetical protein